MKDSKTQVNELSDLGVLIAYRRLIDIMQLEHIDNYCESCDSLLPLVPGMSDRGEVYLFCLGSKCKFKYIPGMNGIEKMKAKIVFYLDGSWSAPSIEELIGDRR